MFDLLNSSHLFHRDCKKRDITVFAIVAQYLEQHFHGQNITKTKNVGSVHTVESLAPICGTSCVDF